MNAPKKPLPPNAEQAPDGHWTIGGVYVGRRIDITLYAEPLASGRHMIRSTLKDPTFATRIGEILGSAGRYQACLVDGTHVVMETSMLRAAKHLEAVKYHATADELGQLRSQHLRELNRLVALEEVSKFVKAMADAHDQVRLAEIYQQLIGHNPLDDDPTLTNVDLRTTIKGYLIDLCRSADISRADWPEMLRS